MNGTIIYADKPRMGRKKKPKFPALSELKEGVRHIIYAIIFAVITIFLLLAAFELAGIAGSFTYNNLYKLLGIGYYLAPALTLALSISFFRPLTNPVARLKIGAAIILFFSGLALLHLVNNESGGLLGSLLARPLVALLDVYASMALLIAVVTSALLMMINTELSMPRFTMPFSWLHRKQKDGVEKDTEEDVSDEEETEEDEEEEEKPVEKEAHVILPQTSTLSVGQKERPIRATSGPHKLPPLSLLETDKGKPGTGDIKANANIIKRTLQNFGITVEMDEISVGPSVTRYALKPAEGVKLSRILGLQNDLALALAAHPIRIEAPIPGKSLVGIEIPNTTRTMVGLGTLFSAQDFRTSENPLLIALGKGISGKAHFANIAKMPHLLIAGTTGAGKSVMIHTLIASLLYRNTPDTLRLILVDPKRVELTLYNNIPHLLSPVITDPKKAILALKWAIKEMERRLDVLEKAGVRDVGSYHKNIVTTPATKDEPEKVPEPLPYIVIIIDELADIMQAYPRELEAGIVRLAQMSRATGIHLILSTQRPSVNVITGLIKANVPSRIALQVASQIDSRTILDASGAEKLLGAGDMLFISGETSKPTRIQSGYVTETEVKKVVGFLTKEYENEPPDEITLTSNAIGNTALFETSLDEDSGGADDDLYEAAYEIVIESGKASTSYIQRRLRVGYARAARLIDLLEERGIIGPADGSKPREIFSNNEDEDDMSNKDVASDNEDSE